MLQVKDIVHVYPNGTRALDGVTISIDKGMFGLLGPNGSGKSSLMRTIATLQTPTSGSIQFGDIDMKTACEQKQRNGAVEKEMRQVGGVERVAQPMHRMQMK